MDFFMCSLTIHTLVDSAVGLSLYSLRKKNERENVSAFYRMFVLVHILFEHFIH